MIEANPVHRKLCRGRRSDHEPSRLEKAWAPPEDVVRIANQAGMLGGPVAELLIITTAWTGCRWGEIIALQRDRVDLVRGVIAIDAEVGGLHESSHGLWLGLRRHSPYRPAAMSTTAASEMGSPRARLTTGANATATEPMAVVAVVPSERRDVSV
jgi:integrase